MNWDKIKNGTKEERENFFKQFKTMAEPCESTGFSLYINEKCKVFPCSFMENTIGWEQNTGYDMLSLNSPQDFLDTVWNGQRFLDFGTKRAQCISCGEGCQYYEI